MRSIKKPYSVNKGKEQVMKSYNSTENVILVVSLFYALVGMSAGISMTSEKEYI